MVRILGDWQAMRSNQSLEPTAGRLENDKGEIRK